MHYFKQTLDFFAFLLPTFPVLFSKSFLTFFSLGNYVNTIKPLLQNHCLACIDNAVKNSFFIKTSKVESDNYFPWKINSCCKNIKIL